MLNRLNICVMELSASEMADRLGVSIQRVHALLRAGELHGRQVSRVWLFDEAQLLKPRKLGRPMSARIAWATILGVRDVDWLSQSERSRLCRRLNRLHDAPNPAQLLATWLAARAEPVNVSAPEPEALHADPDLVPSGISDPRSGVSGGRGSELYAQPGTLQQVIRRHLLIEDPAGEVRLREAPMSLEAPAPLLLLAADLADRGGPREMRRAAELIEEWAQR